jgi:hypothetical protein
MKYSPASCPLAPSFLSTALRSYPLPHPVSCLQLPTLIPLPCPLSPRLASSITCSPLLSFPTLRSLPSAPHLTTLPLPPVPCLASSISYSPLPSYTAFSSLPYCSSHVFCPLAVPLLSSALPSYSLPQPFLHFLYLLFPRPASFTACPPPTKLHCPKCLRLMDLLFSLVHTYTAAICPW